jgi:2'-5' RNA ligase
MPSKAPRRKFGVTQKDRIFFACLPDGETAARIHALAETLKRENGFQGNLILPEHLHVTLFHLGDWQVLPQQIVDIAKKAAGEVASPSFEVTFPRVESFRNRTGIYPFVLTGDAGPWAALRNALGAALRKNGLGGAVHTEDDFKPHVTLLRDSLRVKPARVEPVAWTIRDFVLIHSLLGQTKHIHLGRWNLP